jgi:hypothetical protein
MKLINDLKARYEKWKHSRQYVYGKVYRPDDGYARDPVRLNKETGRIEFIMWKAGEQGHSSHYWHPMGVGWEVYFATGEQVLSDPLPNSEGLSIAGQHDDKCCNSFP